MDEDAIATDARTAWQQLAALGGLELDDRDDGLEAALLEQLPVSATSLDEALDRISIDQLVRALFKAASSYVNMFSAILDFFRKAGAREGRHHWQLKLEERHLDLEQFETLIETWQETGIEFYAPEIDGYGAFALTKALRMALFPRQEGDGPSFLSSEFDNAAATAALSGPFGSPGIDDWLEAYNAKRYSKLPADLHPSKLPDELYELASVAWIIGDLIHCHWGRCDAMEQYFKRELALGHYLPPQDRDGYSLKQIAQGESDYWLVDAVKLLAHARTRPAADLARAAEGLASASAAYGRRRFGVTGREQLLERIFALPVWKERHALYAVWIATEIVKACEGHDLTLHHVDGVIEFAFRSTLLATIHSAEPSDISIRNDACRSPTRLATRR